MDYSEALKKCGFTDQARIAQRVIMSLEKRELLTIAQETDDQKLLSFLLDLHFDTLSYTAAYNPVCSSEDLRSIWNKRGWDVAYAVTSNPNLPEDLKETILKAEPLWPGFKATKGIAANPRTSEEELITLLQHEDDCVREAAILNHNLSKDVLISNLSNFEAYTEAENVVRALLSRLLET